MRQVHRVSSLLGSSLLGFDHSWGLVCYVFACLVWDFHTVVSYQCRNPVFGGSSWRLHSVNQGCGSDGAGIPHNLVAKRSDGSMAHDGQDIDGVFGDGAHRADAGAEEAAAGVMDVL